MILPGVTASGRQVAPSVRTDASPGGTPTGGTTASLELRATILRAENSNNSVTFQWWNTSTPGSVNTTSVISVSQGAVNQSVSFTLTGLAQATSYTYRVVSTNVGGTAIGGNVSATTPINAPVASGASGAEGTATPTATTSNPSNYSKTTATIGGTFTGSSAYMQYDTTDQFNSGNLRNTSSTTTSPITENISGLSGATTYYSRVVATVTSTILNMSGTVNPNGRTTTVTFRYATDAALTQNVATVSGGTFTGTTNQTATASVSVSPNNWYVRIEATNDGGTAYSAVFGPVSVVTKTAISSNKSFTTYTDRSQEFTTATESGVWYYPSIPAGGAAVSTVFAECIGGGGGGGKGINSTQAGGGGAGRAANGTINTNGGNLNVIVGRGGVGAGKVSPYSNNGQGSGVYRGDPSAPAEKVEALGGGVGDSGGAGNGGSSTFAGGAGYVYDYVVHIGGGGGGILGGGGAATSTTAGAGGGGVLGVCGGGGGAGYYFTYTSGTYGYIVTPNPVTGAGNSGGGNGATNADGGNATSYGSGGGGASNGNGGNGHHGYVKISWVGP